MTTKKAWKQFRTVSILVSCLLLALGVVMLIWPEISALAVCIILGVLFIAVGVYELARYFNLGFAGLLFRFDLTLGMCNILIGILLLVHPAGAMVFLPVAAGFYMMMGSVFDIQLSVEMRRSGVSSWWLSLLMGIVSTAFAFFLFLDPFNGASALMIFVGVSLIISGIENLCTILCVSKAVKNGNQGTVIDVTWTE